MGLALQTQILRDSIPITQQLAGEAAFQGVPTSGPWSFSTPIRVFEVAASAFGLIDSLRMSFISGIVLVDPSWKGTGSLVVTPAGGSSQYSDAYIPLGSTMTWKDGFVCDQVEIVRLIASVGVFGSWTPGGSQNALVQLFLSYLPEVDFQRYLSTQPGSDS